MKYRRKDLNLTMRGTLQLLTAVFFSLLCIAVATIYMIITVYNPGNIPPASWNSATQTLTLRSDASISVVYGISQGKEMALDEQQVLRYFRSLDGSYTIALPQNFTGSIDAECTALRGSQLRGYRLSLTASTIDLERLQALDGIELYTKNINIREISTDETLKVHQNHPGTLHIGDMRIQELDLEIHEGSRSEDVQIPNLVAEKVEARHGNQHATLKKTQSFEPARAALWKK